MIYWIRHNEIIWSNTLQKDKSAFLPEKVFHIILKSIRERKRGTTNPNTLANIERKITKLFMNSCIGRAISHLIQDLPTSIFLLFTTIFIFSILFTLNQITSLAVFEVTYDYQYRCLRHLTLLLMLHVLTKTQNIFHNLWNEIFQKKKYYELIIIFAWLYVMYNEIFHKWYIIRY